MEKWLIPRYFKAGKIQGEFEISGCFINKEVVKRKWDGGGKEEEGMSIGSRSQIEGEPVG